MNRYLSILLERLSVFIGLAGLFIFLSVITPNFLTYTNLMSVLRQGVALSLTSIGMTYAIISGGIDLSVGSMMALTGCTSALLMTVGGIAWVPACFIGLVIALLCGTFVGYFIAFWNIQPFIMTLVMMSLARGLALVLTNGIPVAGFPQEFGFIGRGWIIGIPFPVIIAVIFFFIFGYFLRYTRYGVHVYAVGGQKEAANYAGIPVRRVIMSVYMISATLAGLAGLIMTSRLNSGQPILGEMMELDAIASVVIGGTAMSGGQGGLFGTVIGVLIIIFLHNGLNMLGVSSFWQRVAIGLVILIAVLIDQVRQKIKT
ncbi:MAG: ABC transporter permease [Candidatus Atribacteria bacterium]|nr:ABC transporter permease [Candidatus Atribacteria bacterium]